MIWLAFRPDYGPWSGGTVRRFAVHRVSIDPPMRTSFFSPFALAVVLSTLPACATMRGRADDAMERGDYPRAVDLYGRLLTRDPSDPVLKAQLTRAERALFDQAFDRVDAARRVGNTPEALRVGLEAMQTNDRLHRDAIDAVRTNRVVLLVDWATSAIRSSVREAASKGRALVARSHRASASPWLGRPELAALGAELDEDVAAAGVRTCNHAGASAADAPFALELVAAYCKEVGAPLPEWKPRPLLVGGVDLSGTIAGTPEGEAVEIERAVSEAVEQSVWFTATSSQHVVARLDGSVSSDFTREPAELTRSWTERIPFVATETYTEPVEVPYLDTETYTEQVPFTAYEDKLEPCAPPRSGTCTVSRPVTRYRDETRERKVKRYRTEYKERTRQVTKYRDEPRIFRFQATKHEGRYLESFFVRVDLGNGLRPIEARSSAEDRHSGYEHDADFPAAGVRPERPSLPTGMTWRQKQRDRLKSELLHALDHGWMQAFCSEGVSSIEEAARCAHGRPKAVPAAVRARVQELFGDDPDLVLALPRPGEAIH